MKSKNRNGSRTLTESEKAYLKKNLAAEKTAMKVLFWLFSSCFVGISFGVIILFLEGDKTLSFFVFLFNLMFLWLARISRKFKRVDLIEQGETVISISGNLRQEVRGYGRNRRVYHYIGDDCVIIPNHWFRNLKIGNWVEAEAFPLGKQSEGSSILTGNARWSVLSINNFSSIDEEVPLGLLDIKNSSLYIIGAIISLVLIFAFSSQENGHISYISGAILRGEFELISPVGLLQMGLIGLFIVSATISTVRISHNKKIFDRIKASCTGKPLNRNPSIDLPEDRA